MKVRIDGIETVLTFDAYSGARGYQYLTPGARASHAFPWRLEGAPSSSFHTNGHHYEILGRVR